MIRFYDVDTEYADYLRSFEQKVPHVIYGSNSKFVCGIVLSCNGRDYFAPVSSKVGASERMETHIRDENNNKLSSIRYQFMFPAPVGILTPIDINAVRKTDSAYAVLMQKEYEYCRKFEQQIRQKAEKVYRIGTNKNHSLNKYCCDFALLEEKRDLYFKEKMDEAGV